MDEITNFRGDAVPASPGSSEVDAFIAVVGERVRKVRQRKGEHALWSLNRQGALCFVNHVWLVSHGAIAMFCLN